MVKLQLPIFPLPETVLFPGVFLPLRIFEDRYKLMLKTIEDSDSEIAISYAPELSPNVFYPHMVCGTGQVQVLQKYDNGEADIMVIGTRRVRFDKYVQEVPYLIGEGEVVESDKEMPEKTAASLLDEIQEMLIQWLFAQYDDPSRPIQLIRNSADLEYLTYFAGYYFINQIEEKQKFLEEIKLEVRAQKIWQILKDLLGSPDQGPVSQTIIFPTGATGKKILN